MNNKIVKLALDAGLINYVDHATPREYFVHAEADLDDVDQFAKLMVQECISLFDGTKEMKTVGMLSHAQIVEQIRQHFGVEE